MDIKPPAPRALAALNLPTPVLPGKPLPGAILAELVCGGIAGKEGLE
jgi:hypothetical protein